MKQKFKKILSLLFLVLVVPCTVFLCACGPTPTNEARSVRFVSNISKYETGLDGVNKAIFEVDLNVPTHLDFSVSPSSWSGYEPTYSVRSGNYGENLNRFKFEKGVITVINAEFEPIDIEIRVNDHIDKCQVRLRVYPTQIFYEGHADNFTINAGEMMQITPFAKFAGSEDEVALTSDKYSYNYLVETSNPTLISVPDPSVLKIRATQKVPNEAVTVQVYMLNQKGEKIVGLSFSMRLRIVQSAKYGYLKIDGADGLIYDNTTEPVELNAADFLVEEESYQLSYELVVVSENNIKIEDFEYTINCTNADCSEEGIIKFSDPGTGELDINVRIYCTGLYTSISKTYSFMVNLKIKF